MAAISTRARRLEADGPKVRLAGVLVADGGVAAVEFAIIFPIMLVLMLAGLQVVAYINATRKVELIATSISQMISQATPPPGSSTATVNYMDLHFAFDSSLVLFPYLMKDGPRQGVAWWQDIAINFASVQFTQIASNCTNVTDMSACYVANVVWTSTGTTGGNYRPCVTPQLPVDNTVAPSRYSLPRSVYGPGSIIVADISFTFRPTFGSKFLPASTIARSVYVPPRYASLINYDTTNSDGIAIRCPGY